MRKTFWLITLLALFSGVSFSQPLFLDMRAEKTVAPGVKLYYQKFLTVADPVAATALKIDLASVEVRPVIAKRRVPNIVESVFNFLTPWIRHAAYSEHFSLEKVSTLVEENSALAGINGTYFAATGKPLGALMINQELISAPINGRTALLIDAENHVSIDKIMVASYFALSDGTVCKISGINQPRGEEDAILYAPIWGERTGSNNQGIEFVVKDNLIQEINVSNSKIPIDGFVISLSGPAVETITEKLRVKDPVRTYVKVLPYSTSPDRLVHLISGGPRLLMRGNSYVSKHEEKFKADVAEKRAPRSAVGITAQNELLLVVVEGKSGATLEELAEILKYLGAVDAMNLDGGSSSALYIQGRGVTGFGQRKVSNAILVFPK